MRWRIPVAAIGTVIAVVVGLQGCQFFGYAPAMPDLSGTYLARSADIQADQKTVDEIMSAFTQAEDALRRR